MHHWDHIHRMLSASSIDGLKQTTAEFASTLGFNHHGYAAKLSSSAGSHGNYHYFHNYDAEWGGVYAHLGTPEAARTDARIRHARTGMPGIAWNVRGQLSYERVGSPNFLSLLKRARWQAQLAGDFGMSGGLTIPSWSRGLEWSFITLSTDSTRDLQEIGRDMGSVVYFVNSMQASFDRLMKASPASPDLSAREREVLCWSAIGKTSWEISVILCISERTVNFHLQRIADKLGVKGRRAACARAVALGLIAI